MNETLDIQNLHVETEETDILKGVTLSIKPGEVHAIMGPNGSGKSTLAYALMGHPAYKITHGSVRYKGEELGELSPDKRAKLGIFLGFQYPAEVTGVTISNFLRTAHSSVKGRELAIPLFYRLLKQKIKELGIEESFVNRYVNEGFSGGEKKRVEVLQALVLEPSVAIFDEADSGLDVDALRIVSKGINTLKERGAGILLITHYQRILDYIQPDKVHILVGGKIVESGGPNLAKRIEKEGYDAYR